MSKTKRGPHPANVYRERLQKYLPVIRTAYGLRVEDLAQELDISVVTLVNYSSGTNMTISMFYAIMHIFEHSALDLRTPGLILRYFVYADDISDSDRNKVYNRLNQAINNAEAPTIVSRNAAVIKAWKEEEASEESSV